jgi:hypothetical protein
MAGKLLFNLIDWPQGWDEDVPTSNEMPKLEKGDIVVNGWAGLENPHRVGIFIARKNRDFLMSDGSTQWRHIGTSPYRLMVIGHLRDYLKD